MLSFFFWEAVRQRTKPVTIESFGRSLLCSVAGVASVCGLSGGRRSLLERSVIERALQDASGKQREAVRALLTTRTTLIDKMKRLGIRGRARTPLQRWCPENASPE